MGAGDSGGGDFAVLEKKRAVVTDGVCVTGGGRRWIRDLERFVTKLRNWDICVSSIRMDTRTEILKKLVEEKKIDYVAIGHQKRASRYGETAGVKRSM